MHQAVHRLSTALHRAVHCMVLHLPVYLLACLRFKPVRLPASPRDPPEGRLPPPPLQQGEQVFHARLGGHRALRVVVACRVVLRLGDGDGLDLAVVHDEDEALGAHVAKHAARARVAHGHAELAREPALGVRHEGDHGALNALVLRPPLHDGTVVDAVYNDLSDALGLQLILAFQVLRHLHAGSAGREGAGQRQDHHLLLLQALLHVHLIGGETKVQLGLRELVTSLDHSGLLLDLGLGFGLGLGSRLRLGGQLAAFPIALDGSLLVGVLVELC
mmetsp:Transcript_4172/g.13346  ORF Transcript_4172/g.13346 Transcript_4172/m.13346 type:complete len:274 (+) Transcript_4172:291-1112(+)